MQSRADQYRRLSGVLSTFPPWRFRIQGRLNLLEMARIWNKLADEHDRAQPVLQQQQQVQPRPDTEHENGPTIDGRAS